MHSSAEENHDDDDDATAAAAATAEEVSLPGGSSDFVPPSIHQESLISGTSYAHYTSIPAQVIPSQNDHQPGTPCVLGIDEAGRGPVIGPMIYGAFYLPTDLHRSLLADKHHFDDSKALTPAARTELMRNVCRPGSDLYASCGWAIKSLSARDIGAGMLRKGGSFNLNAQAMDATVEIVKGVIDSRVNVVEVYVDTIGNPAAYQNKLERIFPTVKLTVEKKADSLYPCVSAASVVAKVTRDVSCAILYREVSAGLDAEEGAVRPPPLEAAAPDEDDGGGGGGGGSWGSGYPSDARCATWLRAHMDGVFGWGNECRFSWGTAKDMLDLKASGGGGGGGGVKVDWPQVDEGEDNNFSNNMRVSDFLSNVGTESDQLRCWYGLNAGTDAF